MDDRFKEFARIKEITIWGILFGYKQEQVDFQLDYVKDAEKKETEILIFRWWKNNSPNLLEDRLTCTLVKNALPFYVEIQYSDIIGILLETGLVLQFPYTGGVREEVPSADTQKPAKKANRGGLHVVK